LVSERAAVDDASVVAHYGADSAFNLDDELALIAGRCDEYAAFRSRILEFVASRREMEMMMMMMKVSHNNKGGALSALRVMEGAVATWREYGKTNAGHAG